MRGVPWPVLLSLALLSPGCGSNEGDGAEHVQPDAGASNDGGVPDGGGAPPRIAPPEARLSLERYDPRLYRADDRSLAGEWLFTFDPEDDGLERGLSGPEGADGYDQRIQVPFPWQSVLSGVGPAPPQEYATFGSEAALQSYAGVAWYARWIEIPESWPEGDVVQLRFGAVDWSATVWVDGVERARHEGGFTPFVVPLGDGATPGASLLVALRVEDPCGGDPGLLLGKQGGFWYTCAGGIWQDVLLEHHPPHSIVSVVSEPADSGGPLPLRVVVRGPDAEGTLMASARCVEEQCGRSCGPYFATSAVHATPDGREVVVSLETPDAPSWRPAAPCLLARSVELHVGDTVDRVEGYTALRQIETPWVEGHGPDDGGAPEAQYRGFRVGGEPVFVRGVLDQGYHPEGIYAFPSRADRRAELQQVRDWGLNAVRMHIKPEEPWYYAQCDALGLMVVYDLPSARDFAPGGPDSPWREAFDEAAEQLVARDRSHPAILWWVAFNEAWGLLSPPFWREEEGLRYVRDTTRWLRELDPGRPVEDHSPGGLSEILYDGALPHVDTDVTSYHLYAREPATYRERLEVLVDGTWPGSTQHLWGGGVQDGEPLVISEFGGLGAGDTEGDAIHPLRAQIDAMWRHPKLQGWILTQLTDVEWELNGLLRYDRGPKVSGLEELGMTLKDVLGEPYLSLGTELIGEQVGGGPLQLSPVLGTRRPVAIEQLVVRAVDRNSGVELARQTLAPGTVAPDSGPLGTLSLELPALPGVYLILGEALAPGGEVLARAGAYRIVPAQDGPRGTLLLKQEPRFDPQGEVDAGLSLGCAGDCAVSWTLPVETPGRHRVTLVGEIASYDPERRQTDEELLPSTVTVLVNGADAGRLELTDAPCDQRGVLSHLYAPKSLAGVWGEEVQLDLGAHELGQTLELTLRAQGNGLRLLSRRAGRLTVEPALLLEAVDGE